MPPVSTRPAVRRVAAALLLAGLLLLAYQILSAFLVPFLWAIILVHVSWPLNRYLTRALGARRTLAASLMTLLVSAALILPTAWIALTLRTEAEEAYRLLNLHLAQGLALPAWVLELPFIGPALRSYQNRWLADPAVLRTALQALFNASTGQIMALVGNVGRNLMRVLVAMVCVFFVFRDGEALAEQLRLGLVRLLGARAEGYLKAVSATVKAVLISMLVCALAQGVLAGLAYWVAGVGTPVFAAALTALASMIPFAVPFVWGSIGAFLMLSGHSAAGAGLILWCLLVVSWVDNLIRPAMISSAARAPFLLIMFGVLGGLGAFGLVGLFVGPVILAVLLGIWREWLSSAQSPDASG